MGADRIEISVDLVRRLIAAQFPAWADWPIRPVDESGWDNRTFRLGDDLAVRLPSAARYAAAVPREDLWLPRLAPHLSRPVPQPVGLGEPAEGYPWPWSVRRWLPGHTAELAPPKDRSAFALDLADFLNSLHDADPTGGPPPGPENFHRGGSLRAYDEEVGEALDRLGPGVDRRRLEALWRAGMDSTSAAPAVWVHGDFTPSNLLVEGGRLASVIDFGQMAVGDPACDLTIAWTLLDRAARQAFRERLVVEPGAWVRARAWVLWKALILMSGKPGANLTQAAFWQKALDAVLAES